LPTATINNIAFPADTHSRPFRLPLKGSDTHNDPEHCLYGHTDAAGIGPGRGGN